MLFLLTRHVEHDFYMKLRLLTTFSACCIGLIVLAQLFLFERLVGFFSQYLAELSLLQDDPFLKYLPSQIAAAAYCLANYTVNRSFWVRTATAW